MARIVSHLVGFVVTSVAAVASCTSSSAHDCGAPDHDEYACAPLAAGAVGCEEADATYPEGCEVTRTTCLSAYPGPTKCYCERSPLTVTAADGAPSDAGLAFVCPI